MYDFYAVSPARPLLQGNDGFYRVTGIPHKEDVMTSFVRGVAVTKTARQVALRTFSRKCAMLVLTWLLHPIMPFLSIGYTAHLL